MLVKGATGVKTAACISHMGCWWVIHGGGFARYGASLRNYISWIKWKFTKIIKILVFCTTYGEKRVIMKYFFVIMKHFFVQRVLTPKQLKIHGCVLSTVGTDALVLKHHSIDEIFIVLDQRHAKYYIMVNNTGKWNYILKTTWSLAYR